jgi:nucleotide-binding universal stress UspA family protein
MMSITRILCPLDLSECSRHALVCAVAIAKRYGATISALFIVPAQTPLIPAADLSPYPLAALTAEDLAHLRGELETFVKRYAGDVPFTAAVAEGHVVGEIVRRAAGLHADLVVIGTHGRSGFERLMLGSVTERVLVKAPCPVLTVPPRASGSLSGVLFSRILCAVDFSPASMKALGMAAALAQDAAARLAVAYVLERFPLNEPVTMGGPWTPEHDRVASDAALTRLHEAIPDAVRALGPVTELVAEGKPYREILRLADAGRSELIVIGAHGGGGVLNAFGSTTNQVVRRASCPVLTLKA